MMDILRNHPGGICMHGGFETTSAMVSELREGKATHWLTGDGLGDADAGGCSRGWGEGRNDASTV